MSFNLISPKVVLIGLLMLAGCGLTPVYGSGGAAEQWQNAVVVNAPDTVFGFRMRGRLEATLGAARSPQFQLDVAPQLAPVPATITVDGDITRFNVTGNATWIVTTLSGETVTDGLVQTFTSYSATGSTVATQAAESDAQDRLALALADLIVQQLIVQGASR